MRFSILLKKKLFALENWSKFIFNSQRRIDPAKIAHVMGYKYTVCRVALCC